MEHKIFDLEQYARCARSCAAEGIVLLKNDRDALPLKCGSKIALFGRSQFNYFKSGTGSGGMVNTRTVTGIREALLEDSRYSLESNLADIYDAWLLDHPFNPGQGWANEPWYQEEMPVSDEIARNAADNADVAIVLIGRTAGEDQDNRDDKGSWKLTDDEDAMLAAVCKAFSKTIILLNTGNIIDMNWVRRYDPAAVACVWQGGQEGGHGVVDVLSGDVNPSGRLTDTIAENIADYPSSSNFGSLERNIQQEDIYVGYRYFETFARETVLYPFGFGLSYTTFSITPGGFVRNEDSVGLEIEVKNTGSCAGRQVVQIYLQAPQGLLGKPSRALVSFAKTGLLDAGETEIIRLTISDYTMASYDDAGKTGYRSAYVLEEGDYVLYAGSDIRHLSEAGLFTLTQTKLVRQLEEAMAPVLPFERIIPKRCTDGSFTVHYEPVPLARASADQKRKSALPRQIKQCPDQGIRLQDVAAGKADMESFLAQLSDEDLSCIVRGEGMSSPKVTPGCGGAFGGVTDRLLAMGIPVGCCTDGPSGIRMDSGRTAFSLPNGTCLACTWNEALQEELYSWEGLELRKNKIDVLLGPGMNLHRHPLNGRNFEYFSEDPLLSGKCAAAQLRGMQRWGVTGTIKHFAMNTQETGRHTVEHVASERAVREIYLRSFEIAVREGKAQAVMSTYGPVNGFYTASSYDLLTQILRKEWGFTGIVMTDWWAKGNDEGKPGDVRNMSSMIRAQNDLYMVCANAKDNTNQDNTLSALADGSVARSEYQRAATNICTFLMGKPAFARLSGIGDELDRQLAAQLDEDELAYETILDCRLDEAGHGIINPSDIDTAKGKTTMVSIAIRERGIYQLRMTIRAKQLSSLAQIPMSIYKDRELASQITLTGSDTAWQEEVITFSPCLATFFLKFYFAQAGIEIQKLEIVMVKSLEEQIRQAIAKMDKNAGTETENIDEHADTRNDPRSFYSMDTPIRQLLSDEQFKNRFAQALPSLASNGMLQAVDMSFREVRPMASGMIPDTVFDTIETLLTRLGREQFYSVHTPIRLLLEDSAFQTAFARDLPSLASNGMLQSVDMSFEEVRPMAAGMIPDDVFDAIERLLDQLSGRME